MKLSPAFLIGVSMTCVGMVTSFCDGMGMTCSHESMVHVPLSCEGPEVGMSSSRGVMMMSSYCEGPEI